jgi:hypothetical protein
MSNWLGRFAILTVLGALLCSALVVGCGGGGDADDAASDTNAANAPS